MTALREAHERLRRALALRCHSEEEYRKLKTRVDKLEREYAIACDEYDAASSALEQTRQQILSKPDKSNNRYVD